MMDENSCTLSRSNSLLNYTDKLVTSTVNLIWAEYDTDENGWLDEEEMRQFVKDILIECNLITNYNESDFERVFALFDSDGNGRITKPEMLIFIRRISNL